MIKKQTPKQTVIGGFAFFLSLSFLLLLAVLNFCQLPALLDHSAFSNAVQFALGMFVGFWLIPFLVRGGISVFLHELKHSLISNLAGNRFKSISIKKKGGGEFAYEYTSETAEYNAFIALAPYWFPLFTLPLLILAVIIFQQQHAVVALIAGFGYGADTRLNLRDISPRQTDITLIRGGFLIGLLYIFSMTFVLFSYLAAWVLQGHFGLRYLFFGLWQLVLHIVAYFWR